MAIESVYAEKLNRALNFLLIGLFPWFNNGKKINAAAGNEDSMALINLGTDTDWVVKRVKT
jgi:hypothetical protein